MIEVRTPCRLHFGLLAYGREAGRQFGGVGLMIRQPDVALRLEESQASGFTASGPMAPQAAEFAQRVAERGVAAGFFDRPRAGHVRVLRHPHPHTGLGVGTQLGMAVAKAVAVSAERPDLDVPTLAWLVGRGQRSAIGAYGFAAGGLIVEGGKADPERLSPLILRQEFPADWRVVLVIPERLQGLAGERERSAFAQLPAIPRETTAEMCRLVLLGLVPAVLERDLEQFGESLYQLQQIVGGRFAFAQGGVYADPLLARIARHIRDAGIPGVGQSSWGPALYAVTGSQTDADHLATDLRTTFDLSADEVRITAADNAGAKVVAHRPAARTGGQGRRTS